MTTPFVPHEMTVLSVAQGAGAHTPDSLYAEQFWLPVVGPTALWAARRLAFLAAEGPVEIDVESLGPQLGVAPSALRKALGRLLMFRVAYLADPNTFVLLARWPAVDSRWRPKQRQEALV